MVVKLGDIVLYVDSVPPTDPRLNLQGEPPEFPALVYRIHPENYLGLYVFTPNGMQHMRMVSHSATKKIGTWHLREGET